MIPRNILSCTSVLLPALLEGQVRVGAARKFQHRRKCFNSRFPEQITQGACKVTVRQSQPRCAGEKKWRLCVESRMWWHPWLCLRLSFPVITLGAAKSRSTKYADAKPEIQPQALWRMLLIWNLPHPCTWGSHNKGAVNNANCADSLAHRYAVPQMRVNKGMNRTWCWQTSLHCLCSSKNIL